MNYPNFNEEKKLRKKGYKMIVGLDEAGRGPLAGPVLAGAVAINSKFEYRNLKQILNSKLKCSKRVSNFDHLDFDIVSNFVLLASNLKLRDSKKLTPKTREGFYRMLTSHPQVEWAVGKVSEKIIDKINIFEATKTAMVKAVLNLNKKLRVKGKSQSDFLILDGNFLIDLPISQKSIIKADEKVFSCAVASIIAKVTRDKIMTNYDKKYPEYGFSKHKGYGTALHREALRKYGPCKIHRKSFKPIKK